MGMGYLRLSSHRKLVSGERESAVGTSKIVFSGSEMGLVHPLIVKIRPSGDELSSERDYDTHTIHSTSLHNRQVPTQNCNGLPSTQIRHSRPPASQDQPHAPHTRAQRENPTKNDPSIDPQQQNKGAPYMLRGLHAIRCRHCDDPTSL